MYMRAWKNTTGGAENWQEIPEDRVNRELAAAHGDNAVVKLKEKGELETRFGIYKIGEAAPAPAPAAPTPAPETPTA